MKKLLFAAVALIALTTGSQATELPPCNDLATRKVFVNVVNTFNLYEFKEIENDDSSKRWCYAFFSGRSSTWTSHGSVPTTPYMEAIFTVEWINESKGEFWLEVKELGRTCRGINGNPWLMTRCSRAEFNHYTAGNRALIIDSK
jgi:hypothetical protein